MTPPRRPHAAKGQGGRERKAEKLLGVLRPHLPERESLRLLEIGTGAGWMAAHLGRQVSPTLYVSSVDVVDQRSTTEGFRFVQVEGSLLPFSDREFDVVISNHVIEHVGEAAAQELHLREIARVLAADGIVYLATPKRWQVVEPHFRLAFLSWLPKWLRTPYLHARGGEGEYDCEPLSWGELDRLVRRAGLTGQSATAQALAWMMRAEPRPGWALRLASAIPLALFERLLPFAPTHVLLLRHAGWSSA